MRVALFPGDLCKVLYAREPLVMKRESDRRWNPDIENMWWKYAIINNKNIALFIEPLSEEFGIFLIDETFVQLNYHDVAIKKQALYERWSIVSSCRKYIASFSMESSPV